MSDTNNKMDKEEFTMWVRWLYQGSIGLKDTVDGSLASRIREWDPFLANKVNQIRGITAEIRDHIRVKREGR